MIKKLSKIALPLLFASSMNFASGYDCSNVRIDGDVRYTRNVENSERCLVYLGFVHRASMDSEKWNDIIEKNGHWRKRAEITNDVQKEMFYAIEDLVVNQGLSFLGVEGYGIVIDGGKNKMDRDMVDKISLDAVIRQLFVKDEFYNSSLLIEMFYPDKVFTAGIENNELYRENIDLQDRWLDVYGDKIDEIDKIDGDELYRLVEEKHPGLTKRFNQLVAMRSYAGVDASLRLMEAKKIRLGAITFGAEHMRSIKASLDNAIDKCKKVSYMIAEPKSLKNYFEFVGK